VIVVVSVLLLIALSATTAGWLLGPLTPPRRRAGLVLAGTGTAALLVASGMAVGVATGLGPLALLAGALVVLVGVLGGGPVTAAVLALAAADADHGDDPRTAGGVGAADGQPGPHDGLRPGEEVGAADEQPGPPEGLRPSGEVGAAQEPPGPHDGPAAEMLDDQPRPSGAARPPAPPGGTDATSAPAESAPASEVLRGGAWIGVLERAGILLALLSGWLGGIAVVLAVKGLGRYPNLRHPGTTERFIVGTLTSVLWAVVTGTIGRAVLFGLG
jgi:hypothetical protein